MKKLLLLALLLTLPLTTFANELTIDPTFEGQKTLTVVCEYPTEWKDGTPVVAGDVVKVNFYYVKTSENANFIPAGENTTACRQVYDMTKVPDGTYLYVVTAVDASGRMSEYSTTNVLVTVKRTVLLNAPFNVAGIVN